MAGVWVTVRTGETMDQFISCTRGYFKQIHSKQISEIRDLVSTLYISKIRCMLKSDPFGYNMQISQEVAEGIVLYGDKIVSNSEYEHEDDPELKPLNQIGQDMQNMVPVNFLEMDIHQGGMPESYMNSFRSLYPGHSCKKHHLENKPNCFGECLAMISSFLDTTGKTGFVAGIVLKTILGKDGLQLPRNCEVPIDVFEHHIRQMLLQREEEISPMAVHLIVPRDGNIAVSNVTKDKDRAERYIVKWI